jgi:hypothetical protein
MGMSVVKAAHFPPRRERMARSIPCAANQKQSCKLSHFSLLNAALCAPGSSVLKYSYGFNKLIKSIEFNFRTVIQTTIDKVDYIYTSNWFL